MKLDLQSLSAEPLVYMLMHSGAFVTVLGIVFFLIGLLFGRATWGRYQRQTRELRGETAAMKEEIADLKRKLGELSVKPGPAVSIMTETIPMPRRESTSVSTPPAPPLEKGLGPRSAPPAAASSADALTKDALSRLAGNVIKSKTPGTPDGAVAGNGTAPPPPSPAAPVENATDRAPDTPDAPPPPPAAATTATGEPPTATRQAPSALAAIITQPHVPLEGLKAPEVGEIPTLPEIPLPTDAAQPKAEVRPEFHPHLGLIYKDRPAQVDDLTALKGVARPLEQRLHVLGVYTYEQIAGWTKDQVREFSARLAFKDRIEREQWVGQARDLLAKKSAASAAA